MEELGGTLYGTLLSYFGLPSLHVLRPGGPLRGRSLACGTSAL